MSAGNECQSVNGYTPEWGKTRSCKLARPNKQVAKLIKEPKNKNVFSGLFIGCNNRTVVVNDSGVEPKWDVDKTDRSNSKNTCSFAVEWTDTYHGSKVDNEGKAIAVDKDGNAYVTGYIRVDGQWNNVWVRKYDHNGKIEWTDTYNGLANNNDEGRGIAVDKDGNSYVAGTSVVGSKQNLWVRKYSPNGKTMWTDDTYSAGAGNGITVDKDGNAYVVGETTSASILTRKYDTNGNTLWTQTYDSPVKGETYLNRGYGIAVDDAGNAYVTGYTQNYVYKNQGKDLWVGKYNTKGKLLWTDIYNGTVNQPNKPDDIGYGITVDDIGNAYVSGITNASFPSPYGGEMLVRKYDTKGKSLWTQTYHTSNYNEYARGIALDKKDNVYVIGTINVLDTFKNLSTDIWIGKYDSNGKILCTHTHNSNGSTVLGTDDFGGGIAVDKDNNVYVTGTVQSWLDIFVRKYKQSEIK